MTILNFLLTIVNYIIKHSDGSTVFVTILFTLVVILLVYQNQKLYKKYISTELIKRQMMSVETLISNTKKMLKENYLELKASMIGVEEKNHLMRDRDYHDFKFVLSDTMYELKSMARNFFYENHLATMTETEFSIHLNNRTNELLNEFTELLDNNYYFDSVPTRIELYESQNKEVREKGIKMIKDCFCEGRLLAQKFSTRKGRKEFDL